MSDTEAGEAQRAVQAILIEELTSVTDAMIEAGSQALMATSVEFVRRSNGRIEAKARHVSEGDQLAAVWHAMLRAKLTGPV